MKTRPAGRNGPLYRKRDSISGSMTAFYVADFFYTALALLERTSTTQFYLKRKIIAQKNSSDRDPNKCDLEEEPKAESETAKGAITWAQDLSV